MGDLGDVSPLVQVDGLEAIDVRDTVILDGFLEFVDVFHHLELATAGVDLGNSTGLQLVHQSAKDGTITENLLEGAGLHSLTKDGFDPAEHLSLKLGVTLAGDLLNAEKIGSDSHKDSDVVDVRRQ